MQEYVCGFAFSPFGANRLMVLLVLKSRPAWQKGRYNGIGGHVEPGETPKQAMVREFHEEVLPFEEPSVAEGIDWKPLAVMTAMSQDPPWRVHFFSAKVDPKLWAGKTLGNPQDDEPVDWFPVNALPHTSLFNLNWLIPLALDGHVETPIHVTDVSYANTGNRENT